MEIQYETVQVPVAEARRTGRWERKVYYLCSGRRRVGPYLNLLDAQLAYRRAEESMRRMRLRAAAIRDAEDNKVAQAEEVHVEPAVI